MKAVVRRQTAALRRRQGKVGECMEAACFYILYNDYIIRTVGGVVVLKKGCQCGWLPESFPETGMRAVFVISQAPDSAYVRIE